MTERKLIRRSLERRSKNEKKRRKKQYVRLLYATDVVQFLFHSKQANDRISIPTDQPYACAAICVKYLINFDCIST